MQVVYVRHATKAEKHEIDLGIAREKTLIAYDCVTVTILDKGTGSFTLHFIFYDGTELTLNQDELASGDMFQWDIQELRITNTAQTGLKLKVLIDLQLKVKPE